MLNKYKLIPDDRKRLHLLAAISTLKKSNEFSLFLGVLSDLQHTIDKKNRTAVTPSLEQGQGAAQLLDSILTLIGEAETQRDQIRQQTEKAEIPNKASAF